MELAGDRPVSRAARVWLLAVLGPVVAVAAVVTLALLPLVASSPTAPDAGVAASAVDARVVSVSAQGCTDVEQPSVTPGSAAGTCVSGVVEVTGGRDAGTRATVDVPLDVYRAGLEPGADVRVAPPVAAGGAWLWVDVDRSVPLVALVVVFAVVVVAVGRLRGAASLAGLAVAYAAVLAVLVPAILAGARPVVATLAVSVVVMTAVLYTTHGFSAKTSVALLGTVAGLVVSALLAGRAVDLLFLGGPTSEEALSLSALTGRPDLSAVVVSGVLVAGLGVLNDVTVTQASTVWELRATAPGLSRRELYRSGMRVGRDHLGSTVYTIAFAYAGAALPVLLLARLSRSSFGTVVTSAEVAQEVARTCVGGIGLVLAIPVTTAVAAAVAATRADHVAGATADGTGTTGTSDGTTTDGTTAVVADEDVR